MSYSYYGALNPDDLQREVGVPVVVVNYGVVGIVDVPTLERALKMLGKALCREERAGELTAFINAVIEDLRRRTADMPKRPAVYVGAVSFKGAQPFTATQSPYPPLALLNTPSVVDELNRTGFISINFEYLIKKQPEYIFIDEGNLITVLQDFNRSKLQYCSLKAFKEGKVYGLLPFNYYWTNVATALADAYYISKVLYPDRFSGVDPAAKADEIFKAFLGKPLYTQFAKELPGFAPLTKYFNCTDEG